MPARGIRRFLSSVVIVGSIVCAACGPARSRSLPVALASVQSAQAVLPADLDVVMWFDVTRLRDLWSVRPDVQVANVLREYGVFAAGDGNGDAAYWLQLLSRSDRLWIACRPSSRGCLDTVVFARGNFRQYDPIAVLPDLESPVDLGAGWFRYDRRGKLRRDQPARIYLAPPDRCVTTPLAELDAVERSLEQGRGDAALSVEERGLFSMTLRARAVADLVARRSPAAARFLRNARVFKLWLEANAREFELATVVGFEDREQAERARLAFSLVASVIGPFSEQESSALPQIEVVGRDVVVRLRASMPKEPLLSGRDGAPPRGIPEPATE